MNDSTGPQSASQRGLPLVGEPRPERADARRNRLRVLEAADRLFTEQGVKNVSLDAICSTKSFIRSSTRLLAHRFNGPQALARSDFVSSTP